MAKAPSNEMADPAEIIPDRLYMSSFPPSEWMEGFDLIVNLSQIPQESYRPPPTAHYIQYPIDDGPLPLIDLHELESIAVDPTTNAVLEGRRVLVHCDAGLNRSGLVAALVFRAVTGHDGTTAVRHIRICRDPSALCNADFAAYLESLPRLP